MSDKLSETQLISAGRQYKNVFQAMLGMLETLEDKTGYEQQCNDAKARVVQIGKEEEAAKAKLDAVVGKIKAAETQIDAANKEAARILADAKAQAENTRLLAKNEAGLLVQKAQDESLQLIADATAKVASLNEQLGKKQGEYAALSKDTDSKQAELTEILGKIAAAKDEIRKKFL